MSAIILEAVVDWPGIANPTTGIRGGFTVTYNKDGIKATVMGSTPAGILDIITSKRLANGFPPEIETTKSWLHHQWYLRDPGAFLKPPKAPPAPASPEVAKQPLKAIAWVPVFLGAINTCATAGNVEGISQLLLTLSRLCEHPSLECKGCQRFIANFSVRNTLKKNANPVEVKDWTYRFYEAFTRHMGRNPAPRAIIAKQYNWN